MHWLNDRFHSKTFTSVGAATILGFAEPSNICMACCLFLAGPDAKMVRSTCADEPLLALTSPLPSLAVLIELDVLDACSQTPRSDTVRPLTLLGQAEHQTHIKFVDG